MKLTHHDIFALAGYATTKLHKILQANADVIYTASAEIFMVEPDHLIAGNRLDIASHWQDFNGQSATKLVRAAGTEYLELEHMAINAMCYTREDIDEACDTLEKRCTMMRHLVRAHANQTEAA